MASASVGFFIIFPQKLSFPTSPALLFDVIITSVVICEGKMLLNLKFPY